MLVECRPSYVVKYGKSAAASKHFVQPSDKRRAVDKVRIRIENYHVVELRQVRRVKVAAHKAYVKVTVRVFCLGDVNHVVGNVQRNNFGGAFCKQCGDYAGSASQIQHFVGFAYVAQVYKGAYFFCRMFFGGVPFCRDGIEKFFDLH